jgi:asparagine synthase (glutamine-hydrolysing)
MLGLFVSFGGTDAAPAHGDRALRALGRRRAGALGHTSLDVGGRALHLSHAGPGAPVRSRSGRSVLAWEGALHNRRELAEHLAASSGTDAEILVEGLEREGADFLQRIDGEFALVFVRTAGSEALLARDRLGMRPLYCAELPDGRWAAASSVRGVLAAGLVPAEIDSSGLQRFLHFGAVYEPETIVRRVRAVGAGAVRRIVPGRDPHEARWWRLPLPSQERDAAEAAEEMREILVASLLKRRSREVPFGLFLSGGTDSSALALLLAEHVVEPFHTFSLTFEGEEAAFAETVYQRRIAAQFGSNHHEVVVHREEAHALLDDFFEVMDQPSIDGLNVHLLAHAAVRSGVAVCLSGIGGDEVFAGYPSFKSATRWRLAVDALSRVPLGVRRALLGPLQAVAERRALDMRTGKVTHILGSASDMADLYAAKRALFLPAQVSRLLGAPAGGGAEHLSYHPPASPDSVTLWSAFELGNYTRNMLIRDTDTFGNGQGLSIRSPYLDPRLVEAAFRVRGSEKVAPAVHKPLLQAVTRGRLPRFTWDRDKTGFTVPLQLWLQQRFVEAPDLSAWLDQRAVDEIRDGFAKEPGDSRRWSRLWGLAVLAEYLERFTAGG